MAWLNRVPANWSLRRRRPTSAIRRCAPHRGATCARHEARGAIGTFPGHHGRPTHGERSITAVPSHTRPRRSMPARRLAAGAAPATGIAQRDKIMLAQVRRPNATHERSPACARPMEPELASDLFDSLGLEATAPRRSPPGGRCWPRAWPSSSSSTCPKPASGRSSPNSSRAAAAPPPNASAALLAHCPTLHKLGQVVARQPGLDAELRRHLQALGVAARKHGHRRPARPCARRTRPRPQPAPGRPRARRRQRRGGVAVLVARGRAQPRGRAQGAQAGRRAAAAEELAILPALGDFLEAALGVAGKCAQLRRWVLFSCCNRVPGLGNSSAKGALAFNCSTCR